MRIEQRTVGRATVLDLTGKIVLDEGPVQLRQAVDELLASGKLLLVFNMANVPYIDSSGLEELVSSLVRAQRAGGRVWLMEPTKRLLDLFAITKLLTVFEIVEASDIPKIEAGEPLLVHCPMCRPPTPFNLASVTNRARCPACGTELGFRHMPYVHGAEATFTCGELLIATYEGESIEVSTGSRDEVVLRGRLDLFVFDLFERMWRLLPSPRRLVLSVKHADTSRAGLRAVLDLCARETDGSLSAIVMPDLPPVVGGPSGGSVRIHNTMKSAHAEVPADQSFRRGVRVRVTRG